jgi:hypothetical protein
MAPLFQQSISESRPIRERLSSTTGHADAGRAAFVLVNGGDAEPSATGHVREIVNSLRRPAPGRALAATGPGI